MSKNVRLNKDFLARMNGKTFINGRPFFYFIEPVKENNEGYNPIDVVTDPDNVPIRAISSSEIIRTEVVQSWSCDIDEVISMPIELADKFISKYPVNENVMLDGKLTSQIKMISILDEVL